MSDPVSRLNAALSGRYRIERQLGEGGMATVYLAEDLKHKRKVALKVLKPELAAVVGAERFLAEIETTANLQHPHILPLFDSREADGFLFYVMPFVEGETLKDRLDREHQLPVDEAVRIATNVAEALAYAHRHGVIHRDIKPANILLHDGKPVIADFGIALAASAGGSARLTETGLSLGTPHYMSPEQATGDQGVAAASDLWALGCVLYEMLAGEPPFTGTTPQAVVGKIITAEVASVTAVRRSVPAHVDAAIRKSLEKLPADRFRDAEDFIRSLGDTGFRHGTTHSATRVAGAKASRATLVAAGVAAALAIALTSALLRPAPSPQVVRQVLSTSGLVNLDAPIGRRAALAADGSSMLLPIEIGGEPALGLKLRGSADITPIPDTESVLDVVYSPDGRWIAYAVPGELRKRPLAGGSAETLARDIEVGNRVALDWLDDGTILYERNLPNAREVVRITETGEQLGVVFEGELALIWLHGLPGSRVALTIACEGLVIACDGTRSMLYAIDLENRSSRVVLERALAAWYVDTGHIIYVNADGAVVASPFDPNALEVTGPSVTLFDGIRVGSNRADMRLARDGTLLYVEGGSAVVGRQVVWVDRSGRMEPIAIDASAGRGVAGPMLSPDNRRLAVEMDGEVWVKELPDGTLSRITNDGPSSAPVWMQDGTSIAYRGAGDGVAHLRTVRSDGSSAGNFEILYRGAGDVGRRFAFTPDYRGVVFSASPAGGPFLLQSADVMLLDRGSGEVRTLLDSQYGEDSPALSPDGRWLAYVSNETGEGQVFVRPFPETGNARTQVSTDGGREPIWAHNGRELFYRELPGTRGGMWAATYTAADRFEVQRRDRLFDVNGYLAGSSSVVQYDVSSDDQRFVMISLTSSTATDGGSVDMRLVWVQNWFEELERLVGN